MFSDKCPICGSGFESWDIDYEYPKHFVITYYCPNGGEDLFMTHYKLNFKQFAGAPVTLISEWFLIDEKYEVINYFKTKSAEITTNPSSTSIIKLPCYIGPNQIDKVKNYMVIA